MTLKSFTLILIQFSVEFESDWTRWKFAIGYVLYNKRTNSVNIIQFAAVVISENHNNMSAEMTNGTESTDWVEQYVENKKKLLLGVMWYAET